MHKTIALLICYLGKFPWYFRYFLHSCKHNPQVTFYIVTDNSVSAYSIPENVIVNNKTLQEIKETAKNKLGFEVTIDTPYKLCDFKPAYGYLFSELIEGYEFWGYGDIDIIFGNIRAFITDEVLDTYELISVRHDYLTGYFQLFKNNKKMNELFTNSKDYKKVFSSNKYYGFDETGFQFEAFAEKIPLNKINNEVESMMHIVRKMEEAKCLKAYFDFHVIEGRPGKLKWDNGMLTYKNEYEAMLYFRSKGVKISFEQLIQEAPLPAILHWSQYHFIVLVKSIRKKN